MVDNLSSSQLLELLTSRGMIIDDDEAERKLNNIGYYKIKEYADPFLKDDSYDGLLFSSIVRRYYYDKNLRIHLLDAIEVIELAFKNKIANILGKNGSFKYLDFLSWSNKKEYSSEYIISEQIYIKSQIIKMANKSGKKEFNREENLISINDKFKNVENDKGKKYPTVWLSIELLSFGQVHNLYKIMDKALQDEVSDYFGCSSNMLNSWIGTVVLARNLCAHNSNLVDNKLKTVPKLKFSWKQYLSEVRINDESKKYSNRVGCLIMPILELINYIEPSYGIGNIILDFKKLIKPVRKKGIGLTSMIGFKNKRLMFEFLGAHNQAN